MRILMFMVVGFVAVAIAGCGSDGDNQGSASASSPTATGTTTMEQALVDVAVLPGCTMQGQGSLYANTIARSFDCENGDRLTMTLAFGQSAEAARAAQDNTWGTKDGATDQIRGTLSIRPVNLASLQVSDVSAYFGHIDADQRNVWCASYTDPSGTQRMTEYYGVFRHKAILFQLTSFTQSAGTCENSRALLSAQALAQAQLNKLKTLP